MYHSGASYKDLGYKCCAINKIKDDEYPENILIKMVISINLKEKQ